MLRFLSLFSFVVSSFLVSLLHPAHGLRPIVRRPTITPDMSLSTLPAAYYGSMWERDDDNIEMLAKMQIVMLMQEEGPCWLICCPNARHAPGGGCDPTVNASQYEGCDPSCDQVGYQNSVFDQVKTTAVARGLREPHCMVFLNTVYDWPFMHSHVSRMR